MLGLEAQDLIFYFFIIFIFLFIVIWFLFLFCYSNMISRVTVKSFIYVPKFRRVNAVVFGLYLQTYSNFIMCIWKNGVFDYWKSGYFVLWKSVNTSF